MVEIDPLRPSKAAEHHVGCPTEHSWPDDGKGHTDHRQRNNGDDYTPFGGESAEQSSGRAAEVFGAFRRHAGSPHPSNRSGAAHLGGLGASDRLLVGFGGAHVRTAASSPVGGAGRMSVWAAC